MSSDRILVTEVDTSDPEVLYDLSGHFEYPPEQAYRVEVDGDLIGYDDSLQYAFVMAEEALARSAVNDTRSAIHRHAARVASDAPRLVWWPTNQAATKMSKAHYVSDGRTACGRGLSSWAMSSKFPVAEGDPAEVCGRCVAAVEG